MILMQRFRVKRAYRAQRRVVTSEVRSTLWTRSNPGAILNLITLRQLQASKGIEKEWDALSRHK